MFWKKKHMVVTPVDVSPSAPTGGTATAATAATPGISTEKLSGPRDIPELVGRHIVVTYKKNPDWVWILKAVTRTNPRGKNLVDIRVFESAQAVQKQVRVKDWTTFDAHPELVLYEGWCDKKAQTIELQEKKSV